MSNYKRAISKLRGFCDGAGGRSIDIFKSKDSDYIAGYTDGQKAKSEYAKSSAIQLGVVMNEIKTQDALHRDTPCAHCVGTMGHHADDCVMH